MLFQCYYTIPICVLRDLGLIMAFLTVSATNFFYGNTFHTVNAAIF